MAGAVEPRVCGQAAAAPHARLEKSTNGPEPAPRRSRPFETPITRPPIGSLTPSPAPDAHAIGPPFSRSASAIFRVIARYESPPHGVSVSDSPARPGSTHGADTADNADGQPCPAAGRPSNTYPTRPAPRAAPVVVPTPARARPRCCVFSCPVHIATADTGRVSEPDNLPRLFDGHTGRHK